MNRSQSEDKYRYEPQSMGATGGGAKIPVCGRHNAKVATRSAWDPVTTLTPGSEFTFQAHISAHHMGHMTVRVCPLIHKNSGVEVLDKCYVVRASEADKLDKFWFLTPGTGDKTWTAKLPSIDELPASKTGAYTVHWRWNTANSCAIHRSVYKCLRDANRPESKWCTGECAAGVDSASCPEGEPDLYEGGCQEGLCCSEVFTNCADVVFKGVEHDLDATVDGGSGADPQPEPEPEPESEPEDGGGAGKAGCVYNGNCKTNLWCNNKDQLTDWCPLHKSAEDCPTPQCKWGGSTKPGPRPEPEPEPTSHTITPGDVKKLGLKMDVVKKFCLAHKDLLCDAMDSTLSITANEEPLCECSPAPGPGPAPPAPNPKPRPVPADISEGVTEGEDLECGECKKKCSAKCPGGNVQINQCWGDPRYIQCECKDGSFHSFLGCGCKHSTCPALAQVDSHISTKFSGRIHKVVSATGGIADDDA